FRRQATVYTMLASQPLPAPLVPGSTHRLEIHTTGTLLEGFWDRVRLLQAVDSFNQGATRHGLDWNANFDPTSRYDNFVVVGVAPVLSITAVTPTLGPPGTAVTITGTGFAVGTTVTIDGVAATPVIVLNATTIMATIPAHAAGSVNICATNPDTQTSCVPFTVEPPPPPPPPPAVAAIAPLSGPGAGGTLVTITGTGFAGGATVALGGIAATVITVK